MIKFVSKYSGLVVGILFLFMSAMDFIEGKILLGSITLIIAILGLVLYKVKAERDKEKKNEEEI